MSTLNQAVLTTQPESASRAEAGRTVVYALAMALLPYATMAGILLFAR